jgi:hypothetical protein
LERLWDLSHSHLANPVLFLSHRFNNQLAGGEKSPA